MSSRKKKYADTGTDASDAKIQVSKYKAEGERPEKVDPIAEEYGPLFSFGKETVHGNQIAIAAVFSHDHRILFDHEADEYVRYEAASGLWAAVKEPVVKLALAQFIKEKAAENDAIDFLHKRTNSFLGAVLQVLKGFMLPKSEARSVGILHVSNGMMDLTADSPALGKFEPTYWSRRMCTIAYRPEAKCDRFFDELLKPALAAEDVELLQRVFGAALLGDNAAQRFLIVAGEAARGKSTIVTILERVLGLDNVAHLRTDHLPGRFETHAFLNKSLLTAKDVPVNFLEKRGAQMLKALVGDDLFEAEAKYGGKHRMRGRFSVIVTTNNRLRLAMEEDAPAWRRRLLVVNFAGDQPKQRVSNFADVLLHDEAEGILAWMVEGAVKHLRELSEIGDFRLTTAQQTRIDDLIDASRSPELFVRSAIAKKKEADVSVEELTQAYLDFCSAKGWEPFTARQFENVLTNLMQRVNGVLKRNDITRGKKTVRGFKHVTLTTKQNKR